MAKNTIRQFARLFTGLTPGQQREMERALAEMDDQNEITNLNTSLEFLRRKPNQHLSVPQVTATPTVRGALLEWEALPDQRIAIYEIHISEQSNFSSFTTSSTFGQSAIIEGLSTTTFARVRGLRSDGTQGPFSDTLTIDPYVFSIKGRVQETFYFAINNNTTFTVMGGAGSEFDYIPINEAGFTMAWANLSVYGNPDIEVIGTSAFTISLKSVTPSATTVHAAVTPSGYFGTYQIGPVCIPHPAVNESLQVSIEAQDTSMINKFYPSIILYGHLNALELGTNTTEFASGGATLTEEDPSGHPS